MFKKIKSIFIKPPVKVFVYEHEILATLRGAGMVVQSHVDEKHTPLDKIDIAFSFLTYGTLVDLMIHPDKQSEYKGIIQTKDTKREDTGIDSEVWLKSTVAIEILLVNKHVKETSVGTSIDMTQRSLHLTIEGMYALNTEFYLKKHYAEQREIELHKSQTSNNYWIKRFTGILAFFAILSTIAQIRSCASESNPIPLSIKLYPTYINTPTKLDTIQVNRIYMQKTLKQLEHEIDSNKTLSMKNQLNDSLK